MTSSLMWILGLLLLCNFYPSVLSKSWQIDTEGCGMTKGCYRVPSDCSDSAQCTYLLTWQKEDNETIRFQYAAKFDSSHLHPWVAFGVAEAAMMPGATVVDCIVNGSNSNRVEIQMSYNSDHSNSPLNNKYLGLVEGSLEGSMVDGRVFCNFTRLKVVTTKDSELDKMKNLTSPWHILFATGPTDGAGNKNMHDFIKSIDPFPVQDTVYFDKYTDNNNNDSNSSHSEPSKDPFIDTEGCGITKGCYRVPSDCSDSAQCTYLLTWQKEENETIRFEYSAKFDSSHSHPWVAFGIAEAAMMPGATVVDCIVNGSNSNRVEIQMSYNSDHENKPLNNKYLGLVESSLEGSMVNDSVFCNFTRLKVITTPDPELDKMKNLTSPWHILFATGPTDGAGNKKRHDFNSIDPFPVAVTVSFDKYTDNGNNCQPKNAFVRAHVTLMVVAWMILASLAMFTSRYMKNQWKENGTFCGKPAWFQTHRFAMMLTFALSLAGILLIFAHKKWKFIVPHNAEDIHPSLGLAVGSLLVINIVGGMLRPDINSRNRIYFRWFHTIFGHGSHFLAAVTMYFGVMQPAASMPNWSRWVVVAFFCWRILSDVVLTSITIRFKDPPADYVAIANNEVDDDTSNITAWRCAVMITYMIGVTILAATLIVAANISM